MRLQSQRDLRPGQSTKVSDYTGRIYITPVDNMNQTMQGDVNTEEAGRKTRAVRQDFSDFEA
ncbi:uncharacterized protein RSE6_08434 [Rhynchosporium secalis]|uniref:Uncharacterized protein n=1 Tax=Rhynchosporium secalis TaxID=38038 RepID=A0A1E1MGI9_RHYSE|nr:uncharacterized protein RSE6_08434 [Rhynchosporium secalis]